MARALDRKVAIVTGAGGGIGSATARRPVADGAAVLCVDRDADAAARAAASARRHGGHADAVAADVSDAAGNEAMVERAVGAFGGLDVLHANAAVQHLGRLDATSPEQWRELFEVNLQGVALGVGAALPRLRERGGGSIIMTASLLGIVGDSELPAYGAMKGGLRALCRALAAAHGPENIRVNTICPGDVDTPMLRAFFASQRDPAQACEQVKQRYPLRRFAQPEDVAAVVAFLARDDAAYLTGIDVVVDGGLLAQIY